MFSSRFCEDAAMIASMAVHATRSMHASDTRVMLYQLLPLSRAACERASCRMQHASAQRASALVHSESFTYPQSLRSQLFLRRSSDHPIIQSSSITICMRDCSRRQTHSPLTPYNTPQKNNYCQPKKKKKKILPHECLPPHNMT